jgi:hypothetical protein
MYLCSKNQFSGRDGPDITFLLWISKTAESQLKKVIYGLSLHSLVFYPATLGTLSLAQLFCKTFLALQRGVYTKAWAYYVLAASKANVGEISVIVSLAAWQRYSCCCLELYIAFWEEETFKQLTVDSIFSTFRSSKKTAHSLECAVQGH